MVDLFQVNCEEIALEQGKTIKEIAEELGVSKTAVRKQIANLELQTSLRKIGNQFAIEKEQETLIKSAFSQKQSQTKIANQVSDFANQSETSLRLVSMLQHELEIKNRELEIKNKQSDTLPPPKEAGASCSTALLG